MERSNLTQIPLKPEDVVFRTDSDSKSIIIVTSHEIIYAKEGRYGGYILRGELPNEPFRAFYVEPKVEELDSYSDSVVELVSKELDEQPSEIQKITYNYIEVDVEIKKSKKEYTVIDFKPKKNGLRLTAEAIRVKWVFVGSARYPESTTAKTKYQELIFKYPELENKLYYKLYTGHRGRCSAIYYKKVIKAPNELLPTTTKEAKKDVTYSEIISKLKKLEEELEKEVEAPKKEVKKEVKETKEEVEEEKVVVTKEDIVEYLRREGLVQVRLVTFDLPSEYKGAKTTYEKGDNGEIREIKVFTSDPTVYRTLRRKFYRILERLAFKSTAGWILRSNADVKELNDVIAELNKLAGTKRNIWIIETYMPRDYIVNQLERYIMEREMSLKDIQNKLQLEKLKRSQKKQLQKRLEEIEDIIKSLKKELEKLKR